MKREMKMRAKSVGGWCVAALLSTVSLGAAAPAVPLVEAVKKGDAVAVRTLLQQGADVNAPEADGTTALHWAADRSHLEIADLLLRAGAHVAAANRFGATPLALACTTGTAALVERLLKAGANPNGASPKGETALMKAALTGNADTVKLLVAHGAEVNPKESWKGQTALMWAAAEGHLAAVRFLIEARADVTARENAGFTPLLFAVRNGHLDVVRVLVDAGSDVSDRIVTKPSGRGATGPDIVTSALAMAIINAHYELAAYLLEKGADPNVPDARGSVLHALAWMRQPGQGGGARRNVSPPLPTGNLDSLELAKLLLARGANPNARLVWKEIRFDRDDGESKTPPDIAVGRSYLTYMGATPFYLAARHGDAPLMRLLVANGADPRVGTVQNVTPLMAAAGLGSWEGESPGPLSGVSESERLDAVKLAYELGGDVNEVTDFGDTPIIGNGFDLLNRYPDNLAEFPETALSDMRWGGSTALHGAALASGQHAIILFLLEKGARIDARNTLGWTPLMIAEGMVAGSLFKSWPETAEFLRKLMRERGLDPELYSQRGASVQSAARPNP